ncbi:MAG: hypothetical protein O7A98_04775 [Acidobacteria bacterium]|nr:hypothetical protein [Acidobacteriota bacterium]
MNPRILIALTLLVVAACQAPTKQASVGLTTRVESPALELAIADLPAPFVLAENAGTTLRFETTHATGGALVITVAEPEYGLNLQAFVKNRGDAFRARPGGEYNGSRELGTPYGPAYYSRGSYDTDRGREEQTWIFALHPAGDSRLLTLTYTYPSGEGQTRVNELLSVLGEIESMAGTPPATAEASADPET